MKTADGDSVIPFVMFDWITGFLEESGYFGIFLLMALENIFPPIPSELIMPLAGYNAARGQINPVGAVAAGTIGSIVGALPWYILGRVFGYRRLRQLAEKHGRWVTVSPDDLDKARKWFERHCGKMVLLGRLVPTIRTLISIPAGVAEMNFGRFILLTAIGTVIWTGALTALGYVLEDHYDLVGEYLDPVSTGIVVILAGTYLYRVITHGRGSRTSES